MNDSEHLQIIKNLVLEQAADVGLWSTRIDGTLTIHEHMLQIALRKLHAVVEKDWPTVERLRKLDD